MKFSTNEIAKVEHEGVFCSWCPEPILAGELITDNPVFKSGELDSIELLHADCAKEFRETNC